MTPVKNINERSYAFQLIQRWHEEDSLSFTENLSQEMPGLSYEILLGYVRFKNQLNYLQKCLVSKKPSMKAHIFLNIGLYQIFFLKNIPEYAIVNETVDASKKFLAKSEVGFLNATLKNALKRKGELETSLSKEAPQDIQQAHPAKLFSRWTKKYGQASTHHICAWNNQKPSLSLRITQKKISTEAYLTLLKDKQIEAYTHPAQPDRFLRITEKVIIHELPGYEEGLFYVQDPSTARSIELLAPKDKECILDACAAPGGKTIALYDAAEHLKIIAADNSPRRIEKMKQNIERLNLLNIDVLEAAWDKDKHPIHTLVQDKYAQEIDAAIIDVPCSNTGVIQKQPDSKWNFSEKKMQKLTKLQYDILSGVAPHIRDKGRIVYSTCCIEPEENEKLIKRWISNNPAWLLKEECRLLPGEKQTHGAYVALLRKKR